MANEKRGEFTRTLGDLEITVVPSFNRISRAETSIGLSCLTIANNMAQGNGLTMMQTAVFIEQVTKPKMKREEIGKAVFKSGLAEAMVIVGLVCERALQGEKKSEADDDESVFSDEEDEGK